MSDAKDSVVYCPHCGDPVLVQIRGCGVICHGAARSGKPLAAHSSAKSRAKHARNPTGYGCGGAFSFDAAGAVHKLA